ncbi:hypothetical protein QFC21_001318 [Naganishia friedmannii]|uniref:Uncharacterized protein n=1 Tax=Naganishia friedmannii TaxID=89922 RepID=A0ACC2W4A6_9TREE|nr:hypothetical protein QFC21_001318 [Naganishia friedmannii]
MSHDVHLMAINDQQYIQPTLATPQDSYIAFSSYPSPTTDDRRQANDPAAAVSTAAGGATFDQLPVVVPSYPTCPHKEVIREDQVEEWVGRRALEFAFTRHGERRSMKRVSAPTAIPHLAHLDPTLTQPSAPIDVYQTLHSALASHVPPSPTPQEIESLGAAASASASASEHGDTTHIDASTPASFPEAQDSPTPSSGAGTSARKPRTGAAQYESIVEYRCCWSGSYRPRAYENKTGQKRQRAPSTKVGCKAKFVIRKIAKTGQINVTYHWLHNGHDPTDIDQIKRMRSAQLPEAIKTYLRGRQETEARRVKKDRAADGVGSSSRFSGKRKRTEEEEEGSRSGEQSSRRPTSPAESRMTMFVDPRLSGMMASHPAYHHYVHHQVPGNAAPSANSSMFIPLSTTAEQDQSTMQQNGLQAQDQHQQMLALIPAPSNGSGGLQDQVTVMDGSDFMPQLHGMDSVSLSSSSSTAVAGTRWTQVIQQQVGKVQPLSDLRTPTAAVTEADQTMFQENEVQLSITPSMEGTLIPPPALGSFANPPFQQDAQPHDQSSLQPPITLDEFRQGVNTTLLGLHALVGELEQLSPDLPLVASSPDPDAHGDVGTRSLAAVEEVRETMRLGEEFMRRVARVMRGMKGGALPVGEETAAVMDPAV